MSLCAAVIRSSAISLCFVLLTGCGMERDKTGPTREEPFSIDLGDTERANVELNVAAGQLNLKGGGGKLVSGDVRYNSDRLKPVVESSRNGAHTVVTIQQSAHGISGNGQNEWNLQISNRPLLDLAINCGAGQDTLDLRDVVLRHLKVTMGAGELDLDLRGHPTRDYDVEISGGVGQATIHLPQNVGIWAEAHGGIGNVSVPGLQKVEDHYENALYDKAKVNVRLKVQGGIGEIELLGS